MVAHQSGIWLEQQLMQSWISSFLLFPLKFTKFIWVSDYKSLFSWNKGCKVPISKKCQMFSKGPIKIQMATSFRSVPAYFSRIFIKQVRIRCKPMVPFYRTSSQKLKAFYPLCRKTWNWYSLQSQLLFLFCKGQ